MKYQCPVCKVVKLAPSRMRPRDIRRFCLPCSEAGGELVDRVSLVRQARAEAIRAATKESRDEAAQAARWAIWHTLRAATKESRDEAARLAAEAKAHNDRVSAATARWHDSRRLTVDVLTEHRGQAARWAIWHTFARRGLNRPQTISVPARVVRFTDTGAYVFLQREDTGEEVQAKVVGAVAIAIGNRSARIRISGGGDAGTWLFRPSRANVYAGPSERIGQQDQTPTVDDLAPFMP